MIKTDQFFNRYIFLFNSTQRLSFFSKIVLMVNRHVDLDNNEKVKQVSIYESFYVPGGCVKRMARITAL